MKRAALIAAMAIAAMQPVLISRQQERDLHESDEHAKLREDRRERRQRERASRKTNRK